MVEEAWERDGRKCFVAWSGGKDSGAVAHMVCEVSRGEIPIWHWDYGMYMPRPFEEEILHMASSLGIRNLTVDYRGSNPSNTAGMRAFFGILAKRRRENDWTTWLSSLRREESSRRKAIIAEGGQVFPIADWTWRDVWAYHVANDLPWHSAYDRYGPVLGWDRVRFVSFFDPDMERFGGLALDGVLIPEFKNRRGGHRNSSQLSIT